jgi:hypothetical protein
MSSEEFEFDLSNVATEVKTAPVSKQVFCQNCGKELKGNAKFCDNCGTNVNSVISSQKAKFEDSDTIAKKSNPLVWVILVIVLAIMAIILFPVVRDMGKSGLERDIERTFQRSMSQDDMYGAIWRENEIEVKQVHLVRKSWNTYDGIVQVSVKGRIHNVSIEVTKDGSSAMWKTTEPKIIALGFLGELYLKKMQEESERQLKKLQQQYEDWGW